MEEVQERRHEAGLGGARRAAGEEFEARESQPHRSHTADCSATPVIS
jgi:hypothetical protein